MLSSVCALSRRSNPQPIPTTKIKDSCAALYHSEKSQDTEMRSIIGSLQEHIEREEERLGREQEENYRRRKEDKRVKLEQRLLSGADCGWAQINKSAAFYGRCNGRNERVFEGIVNAYEPVPTATKRQHL